MQSNPALMYNFTDCLLDRGYGSKPDYDIRDDRFLMRDIARLHFVYTGSINQTPGKIHSDRILDQGVTNLSAAYAWRHWLSASPDATALGPDVMMLYHYSMKYVTDKNAYPTTIRACALALMELGNLEAFVWAKSAGDVMNWVRSYFGPVVITAPWYEGMDDPTLYVMHARGEPTHWHSFTILSYVPSRDSFVVLNSHGLHWGKVGRKMMPFSELQFLFEKGAIACGATGKTVGAIARDVATRNRKVIVEL